MLTGFQVSTGAYATEDYELFCESCFDAGDTYCRAVSNYELDAAMSDDIIDDGEEHVEYCSCEYGVLCDGCGVELREASTDPDCEELREEDEDADPALD